MESTDEKVLDEDEKVIRGVLIDFSWCARKRKEIIKELGKEYCALRPKITQIEDNLFLGKLFYNKKTLDENKIKTIISVAEEVDPREKYAEDYDVHYFPFEDHPSFKIGVDKFIEISEIIEKAKDNVLIHCISGMSRTGAVAIAYYMWKKKISFENAYKSILMKRNIIPNNGFCLELLLLEEKLGIEKKTDLNISLKK